MAATDEILNQLAGNAADLNNTDLATRVFTAIFGDNWWNLTQASGNHTLIYDLLLTLNSCCAIAVAWLMILTVLISSVGAAQEGRSIGGRYSSAWVPLRFSFSFAAITPVFNGLCAMQMLILACIGVSINLANEMYETGLDWLADKGSITTIAPPKVAGVGQQLAIGAVKSQALVEYLRVQANCEGLEPTQMLQRTGGETTLALFYVPQPLICNGRTIHLPKEAFGGFRFKNTEDANLDSTRISAIQSMLAVSAPIAGELALMNPDFNGNARILAAGRTYTSRMATAASAYAQQGNKKIEASLKSFRDVASTAGWFTAGSYYWSMATAAQDAMDRVSDSTEYIQPQMELLVSVLHDSWGLNVAPNIARIQQAATENSIINVQGQTQASADIAITGAGGLGQVRYFFDWLNAPPWAEEAASSISGPDAIITTVQYARFFVNAATSGMVLAEAVKLMSLGTSEVGTKNLPARVLDFFTGAGSATRTVVGTLVQDIAFLAMLGLGAIWAFANLVAYVVPAMPFLIWVAAIVGWIVLSLEAVTAAPLWLIGHSLPEGEGFAGNHGRQGYLLVLGILLRPVLLVLSMFLCMIIMQATGSLVNSLFAPFTKSMQALGSLGIVGNIFLFVFLAGTVALLTWKTFDLVTAMPDRIIRWIGQQIQPLGNEASQAQARDVIGQTDSTSGRMSGAAGTISGYSAMKFQRERGGRSSAAGTSPHTLGDMPVKNMGRGKQ